MWTQSDISDCLNPKSPIINNTDIFVFRNHIPTDSLFKSQTLMHHHALAVEGYEPAIHDGITSDTQLHAHILHTYNAQFADVRFSYAAMAPELETREKRKEKKTRKRGKEEEQVQRKE